MRTKIRRTRVRYHRNGVGGEGFFAVTFVTGTGVRTTEWLGIVFTDEDEETGTTRLSERVAVVDLASPLTPYRGHDEFGPALLEAITEAQLTGEAFRQ
jgi:hypothetical protein